MALYLLISYVLFLFLRVMPHMLRSTLSAIFHYCPVSNVSPFDAKRFRNALLIVGFYFGEYRRTLTVAPIGRI